MGELLVVSSKRFEDYVWKKDVECLPSNKITQNKENNKSRNVNKEEMTPSHKLLFEIMHEEILLKE